jgi:hypothetical protein
VTTGNGTELYIPDGKTGSSNLWVYVPQEAKSGNYTINLTVFGQGVRSNALLLKVRVEGRPMYDAIISGQNRSAEGYPQLNLSPGQPLTLRVRIYNSWISRYPFRLSPRSATTGKAISRACRTGTCTLIQAKRRSSL